MTLEDLCREKTLATEQWRASQMRNVAGVTLQERVQIDLEAHRAYMRMVKAEQAYNQALRAALDHCP